MKSLLALFALLSFGSASAETSPSGVYTLDCEYQVMARYSERAARFDLNIEKPYTFTSEKFFNFVDAVGANSNAPYKVLFQAMPMVNGVLDVTFAVYEKVKIEGGGFTGRALYSATASFANTQREIAIRGQGPEDVGVNLRCQIR